MAFEWKGQKYAFRVTKGRFCEFEVNIGHYLRVRISSKRQKYIPFELQMCILSFNLAFFVNLESNLGLFHAVAFHQTGPNCTCRDKNSHKLQTHVLALFIGGF